MPTRPNVQPDLQSEARAELRRVPLRLLLPNPLQPRQVFTEGDLQDLENSIREHGILQPPVVRPGAITPTGEEGYYLIAGERRMRAAERVGFYEIEVIVRHVTPLQGGVLAAVENLQRADLHPFEEADMILALQAAAEESGEDFTLGELSRQLGKGHGIGWIKNRLDLPGYGTDVQQMVKAREDTLVHARYIDGVARPEMRAPLIELSLDDGPLVVIRELARYIQEAGREADETQLKRFIEFYDERRAFLKKNLSPLTQRIEATLEDVRSRRASNQAPDQQTQRRSQENVRTGGGNMSRGQQVTGASAQETNRTLKTELGEAQRHLLNASAWAKGSISLSKDNQASLLNLRHLIDEMLGDQPGQSPAQPTGQKRRIQLHTT